MSRRLADLDPRFRPIANDLLARLTEAKIPVLIVCTGRTAEEQAEAVRTGHSKVLRSRHQDGMAIDLVPYSQYDLHGPDKLLWDLRGDVWWTMGDIGQALGLRWGGTFRPLNDQGLGWDPGHFELPEPTARPGEVV